jgi:type IX secretion system substrate protein
VEYPSSFSTRLKFLTNFENNNYQQISTMKGISLTIFFAVFMVLNLNSQSSSFELCYGGVKSDEAFCIQEIPEGGYIICGHTRGGDMHYRVSLLRIDMSGNVVWNETYGYSNTVWTALTSGKYVQLTLDQNFIVAGGDDNGDMWILKINAENGSIIWEQNYVNYTARCVEPLSDGTYIVCGSKKVTEEDSDLAVVKLNSDGTMIWQKTYGGDEYDIGYSIKPAYDIGYIVTGLTRSFGNGDSDIWLLKLDEMGDLQWSVTEGYSSQDYAQSVIQFTDSCYVIAGSTFNSIMNVMKFDINGELLWNKSLGGTAYGTCIQQTNDGGLIVSGKKLVSNSDYDYRIYKLNEEGEEIWHQDFGYSGSDNAWHIIQTSDGGYAVAGGSWSCDPNSSSMWILKLDESGNLVTDVSSPTMSELFNCYPVPAGSNLNVSLNFDCDDNINLQLFSFNGQTRFFESINFSKTENPYTIDLTGFSDGIYFLKMAGNDFSFTRKIIVSSGKY